MKNAEQLLKDESFVKQMTEKESVEEIVALFAENGVQISEGDVAIVLKMIAAGEKNGEVTEADLDDVAGGAVNAWNVFSFVYGFVTSYGPKIAKWAEKTYSKYNP